MPDSSKDRISRANKEFVGSMMPDNPRFTSDFLFRTYKYGESSDMCSQRTLYEKEQRIGVSQREYSSVMHHVQILMPPEEALRRSLRIKVMQLMAELDAGRDQTVVSLRKILFSDDYDVDKDLEKIILTRLVMEEL